MVGATNEAETGGEPKSRLAILYRSRANVVTYVLLQVRGRIWFFLASAGFGFGASRRRCARTNLRAPYHVTGAAHRRLGVGLGSLILSCLIAAKTAKRSCSDCCRQTLVSAFLIRRTATEINCRTYLGREGGGRAFDMTEGQEGLALAYVFRGPRARLLPRGSGRRGTESSPGLVWPWRQCSALLVELPPTGG